MEACCNDCIVTVCRLTEFEVNSRKSLCLCFECLSKRGDDLWDEIKPLISPEVGSSFEELRQDRLAAIQEEFSLTYTVLMDGFLLAHEREEVR